MHLKRRTHAEGIDETNETDERAPGRPGVHAAQVRRALLGTRRRTAATLAVLLSALALALPSPYTVEGPGPTANVLGDDSGTPIITVNASGVPGYPVSNLVALWAWLAPGHTVTPSEAVFPVGQSAEEYVEESEADMTGSQDAATTAALAYARTLDVDTDGVTVSMHVDDIGGPSAGMMYALGLIDKLTPESETGGLTVAGTGTMDDDGNVGAIGGIRLKMIGAKRDGATWFLAPESNCDEVVGHVPDGLRDVKVTTLDDAYRALVAIGRGEGDDLPHCSA